MAKPWAEGSGRAPLLPDGGAGEAFAGAALRLPTSRHRANSLYLMSRL